MTNKIVFSLQELASLQVKTAHRHCSDQCRGYHVSWPLLRANALVGGIDSDKDLYVQCINKQFANRNNMNILIAGCADSGILNMLFATEIADAHIDIVDRCMSPLECSINAVADNSDITIIQNDLLTFVPEKKYDLIVCHSLLPFFDDEGRGRLLRNFALWLDRDGKLLISMRNKTEDNSLDDIGAWIEQKTQTAFARIDTKENTYFRRDDLVDYYTIMSRQNLPYRTVDEAEQEFRSFGLKIQDSYIGGKGLSFVSNGNNPHSLILMASK